MSKLGRKVSNSERLLKAAFQVGAAISGAGLPVNIDNYVDVDEGIDDVSELSVEQIEDLLDVIEEMEKQLEEEEDKKKKEKEAQEQEQEEIEEELEESKEQVDEIMDEIREETQAVQDLDDDGVDLDEGEIESDDDFRELSEGDKIERRELLAQMIRENDIDLALLESHLAQYLNIDNIDIERVLNEIISHIREEQARGNSQRMELMKLLRDLHGLPPEKRLQALRSLMLVLAVEGVTDSVTFDVFRDEIEDILEDQREVEAQEVAEIYESGVVYESATVDVARRSDEFMEGQRRIEEQIEKMDKVDDFDKAQDLRSRLINNYMTYIEESRREADETDRRIEALEEELREMEQDEEKESRIDEVLERIEAKKQARREEWQDLEEELEEEMGDEIGYVRDVSEVDSQEGKVLDPKHFDNMFDLDNDEWELPDLDLKDPGPGLEEAGEDEIDDDYIEIEPAEPVEVSPEVQSLKDRLAAIKARSATPSSSPTSSLDAMEKLASGKGGVTGAPRTSTTVTGVGHVGHEDEISATQR